ncbi:TadE/TadG family type IV pilus assembly protein [Litorisediminicola beolgyonensis]|uniref:TadE/TadG family type IV pilus assembly protein n=1 Tax=Litorisediminicola beolgyonensis TaxID=1173614 RepID=A0ABW3ZDV3_9RHOB
MLSDRSGVTFVEALLVMPILILMMAGMIELGVLMAQFNQTVKAMHIGARYLAVSYPVLDDSLLDSSGGGILPSISAMRSSNAAGQPSPNDGLAISCTTGSTPACNSTRLNAILTGGDGVCGRPATYSRPGICDVAPAVTANNLRVTYFRTGLGYAGRPYGPVATIRLELINFRFDFMGLAGVLALFGANTASGFVFQPQPVTITSEDMWSVRCDPPATSC